MRKFLLHSLYDVRECKNQSIRLSQEIDNLLAEILETSNIQIDVDFTSMKTPYGKPRKVYPHEAVESLGQFSILWELPIVILFNFLKPRSLLEERSELSWNKHALERRRNDLAKTLDTLEELCASEEFEELHFDTSERCFFLYFSSNFECGVPKHIETISLNWMGESQRMHAFKGRICSAYKNFKIYYINDIYGPSYGFGTGSQMMKILFRYCKTAEISQIEGSISYMDADHIDRLRHYYKKHGFNFIFPGPQKGWGKAWTNLDIHGPILPLTNNRGHLQVEWYHPSHFHPE